MVTRVKNFHMPKKLEIEPETLSDTYGKFYAEPFERGFGITLGSALRRVMLSSISGAAVTSVKIHGVFHEFASLPGVKEDITEIILNVKNLRFNLYVDKPKVIQIKRKGAGPVFAKEIIHDADLDLLTPNLQIATLDKDGSLDMEMVVKMGSGYSPSDRNKEENAEVGVIPIDTIFSPIQRVNYTIENARVGRVTDYDRLVMEVWTDGSITPEEVVGMAAKILKDHLTLFCGSEEISEVLPPRAVEAVELNKNLLRSVSEMELSVRAVNCLKNADIKTISDLVQRSEVEMLGTKNFGRKSLNEIKEILRGMGLSLGMDLKGVPELSEDVVEKQPS